MHPRDAIPPRHRRSPRRGRTVVMVAAAVAGGAATFALLSGPSGVAPPAGPTNDRPATDVSVRAVSRGGGLVPVRVPTGRDADRGAGSGSQATGVPGRGPVVRATAVLRDWDERRARAWAEGDLPGLRGLYVDEAGAADVRLLRRYTDRGLRVEGLTTQLLVVEVLGRGPDRWRLRVTDRVAGGVVVGARDRLRLPRDRADIRVVRLVRVEGTWRVAAVRPA